MALIHEQRAIVHHRLVVVKQLHLHGACPRSTHSPAVEQAGARREVAESGTGVVFEDGYGGGGALQVDFDELREAVDGRGVCDFQREVARVARQVLEGSEG